MKQLDDLKEKADAVRERIRIKQELIGSSVGRQEEYQFYKAQSKLARSLTNDVDMLLDGAEEVKSALTLSFPHTNESRKKKQTSGKHRTLKHIHVNRAEACSSELATKKKYMELLEGCGCCQWIWNG